MLSQLSYIPKDGGWTRRPGGPREPPSRADTNSGPPRVKSAKALRAMAVMMPYASGPDPRSADAAHPDLHLGAGPPARTRRRVAPTGEARPGVRVAGPPFPEHVVR